MFAVELVFWEGSLQVGLLPCVFETPLSLQFRGLPHGRNSIQYPMTYCVLDRTNAVGNVMIYHWLYLEFVAYVSAKLTAAAMDEHAQNLPNRYPVLSRQAQATKLQL